MNVAGKAVVVTGGAAGIGRAMARRFAAEGARGVVVADRDAAGAAAVAAELGPRALGLGCDVALDAEVGALMERASEAFGPVDVFCANAGVGGGSDLDTPDELWDEAFAVNVKSHVYAARRLVPGWLERGEGYFLATASAAGLLNQIGAAPYAVTKHATVAFAEWLNITYGDRGIRVSCICPMGVRTKLLEEGMTLPGTAGAGLRLVAGLGAVLDPDDVAAAVVEGMRDERFLILPHPEVQAFVQRKVSDPERWLAGMRGLQTQQLAALADG